MRNWDCTGRNSNGVPRPRNSGLLREIVGASGVANQMKSWALCLVRVQAVQSTVVVNARFKRGASQLQRPG